jgi:CHAT domain-containing protein/tetratricopeptide (TPR) repeat protein
MPTVLGRMLVALSLAAAGSAQTGSAIGSLQPGKPVEKELAGGQAHEYGIELLAGQYLHAVVDQRGIAVVVTLVGPSGKQIMEVASSNATFGPQSLAAVVDAAGSYRIAVRSPEKNAPAGKYEIRIAELRVATEQDRQRIQAQAALDEGTALVAKPSAATLKRALEKATEALTQFRAAGDPAGQVDALDLQARANQMLGNQKEALEQKEQLVALLRKMGERSDLAAALNNLAIAYSGLGMRKPALDTYGEALGLARGLDDRRGEAFLLSNIGDTHFRYGEYEKALEYYEQALPLEKELNPSAYPRTLADLGSVYGVLGDREKAEEFDEQALPILHRMKDRVEARVLNGLGVNYLETGQTQKALDCFQQVLAIAQAAEVPDGETFGAQTGALHNLGSYYSSQGDYAEALEYYSKALAIESKIGAWRGEAATLDLIGQAQLDLLDFKSAADRFEEGLKVARGHGDRRGEERILYQSGMLAIRQGDLPRARDRFEASLAVAEGLRSDVARQELRASYFSTVQDTFKSYIWTLMALARARPNEGLDSLALEAAERGRARSFLEMLREARVDIRRGVDDSLRERESTLLRQIDDRAQRAIQLASSGRDPKRLEALRLEISGLENEHQQVQAAIRKSSPGYSALTQPQPLAVTTIQHEVLDSDTLMLEYSVGKTGSFLWVIAPDALDSFALPKEEEIGAAARRFYALLTARNQRPAGETPQARQARIRNADAQLPAAAAGLSKIILQPAAPLLNGKRLVVIADGALEYIPFEALADPSKKDYVPLLAGHEIVREPSASVLALQRRETSGRKPAPRSVAVLADPVFDSADPRVTGHSPSAPLGDRTLERAATGAGALDAGLRLPRLPFTRDEAAAVLSFTHGEDGRKALDFDANLDTAMSPELRNYRIVHFATHGLFHPDNPSLSGLVFSLVDRQGKPVRGFLRLQDIYNLDLPAELVVLSACQTALGKELKGEGMVGLTRGFMYAGSRRVVASLWKVDDFATAELMKRFYGSMLTGGHPAAAALREAKISLFRQRAWSSPYFWAAFIVQGEWR